MQLQNGAESIVDQVHNTVTLLSSSFELDEQYIKGEQFHAEMKRLGLAKKQEYNIPLIDTIGRRHYELMKKFKRSRVFLQNGVD